MNLYAIGDVHGCLTALEDLMGKVYADIKKRGGPSKIVFLGDYVDRGPDSAGVLEYVENIQSYNPDIEFVFLKGNHEDFFVDYLDGSNTYDIETWKWNGGQETVVSYIERGWELERHQKFLRSLKLNHRHGPYTFVHANLDPFTRLQDQIEKVMLWGRVFDNYRDTFLDTDLVIRGHTPQEIIKIPPHQLNIDTACVFGGKLTAVRLPESVDLYPEGIEIFQTKERNPNKWASL